MNVLKEYIELNINLRIQATTVADKDTYKLMSNSAYGKTMENLRNRIDVRLIRSEEELNKVASKSNYEGFKEFSENLIAAHMKKTEMTLNKPTYLGFTVLEESKVSMNKFHYKYILKNTVTSLGYCILIQTVLFTKLELMTSIGILKTIFLGCLIPVIFLRITRLEFQVD